LSWPSLEINFIPLKNKSLNLMIMKKIGVLLHGCGVYDGTEIQEAVLSLLALKQAGFEYECLAFDRNQQHVLNHLTGEEMKEQRNMLIESARIARGDIKIPNEEILTNLSALVLPGGFGTAKNFTQWAFEGAAGAIQEDVKNLILHFVRFQKPILALCMSPTTVAKALENTPYAAQLSVGTTSEKSPYEIEAISQGITATGNSVKMTQINEVSVDANSKIICAPCYMMEADIAEVYENIVLGVRELKGFL